MRLSVPTERRGISLLGTLLGLVIGSMLLIKAWTLYLTLVQANDVVCHKLIASRICRNFLAQVHADEQLQNRSSRALQLWFDEAYGESVRLIDGRAQVRLLPDLSRTVLSVRIARRRDGKELTAMSLLVTSRGGRQ